MGATLGGAEGAPRPCLRSGSGHQSKSGLAAAVAPSVCPLHAQLFILGGGRTPCLLANQVRPWYSWRLIRASAAPPEPSHGVMYSPRPRRGAHNLLTL